MTYRFGTLAIVALAAGSSAISLMHFGVRDSGAMVRGFPTQKFHDLIAPQESVVSDCAVLHAYLPHQDSIEVVISRPECGQLRLVLAGEPHTWRTLPPGHYAPGRYWEIPVALVNQGPKPVPLPIKMRVDKASPVQRGRLLDSFYARRYFEFPLWDGQRMQQPWSFDAQHGADGELASGASTATQLIKISTDPLAQGFRIIFEIPGAHQKRQFVPRARPGDWPPVDTAPSNPAIDRVIATAEFPDLRAKHTPFQQPQHDLVIFRVSYGSPHNYLSGCFYSHAVGLQLGDKVGWATIRDHCETPELMARVSRDWFEPHVEDQYLFSPQFLDTLSAHFGPGDPLVNLVILRLVTGSPHAPRGLLIHLAEELYTRVDQPLARMLTSAPAAQTDPVVLTLLANLPSGGPPYDGARAHAREVLRRLAPALVRDSSMTERTLFVLAQVLQPFSSDTILIREIAEHPKVRGNPAILTVLAENRREFRPSLLASVRASERVKRMLAEYLEDGSSRSGESELGDRLLRDDEAGYNQDVLVVLANLFLSRDQEVTWAASRRLPESALMRWEPSYVPVR